MTFYQLPPGAYPHDVAPAPDGTVWYSGQRQGRSAASIRRPASSSRSRSGRARRRTASSSGRTARLGHRRRAERHRARRSGDQGGQAVSAAEGVSQRQSQHARLRQAKACSGSPARTASMAASIRRPARSMPGRRRRAAAPTASRRRRRRGLVRLARRRSHRPDRYRERRGHRRRSAAQGRRPAPHLVGFQGHAVGELLARRRDRPLRSGGEDLEDVSACRRASPAPTRSMSTTRTGSG